MNELTIGESSETDVESEEEDKDNLETETDDEAGSFHGGTGTTTSAKAASSLNATKEETYESIQSSTAVSGCTVPMDSNESMLDMSSPVSEASQKTLFAPGKPKVGMKMKLKEDHSNWSEEKKLAFLRERAAKIRRNIRQPIIVHARPIVVDEKDSSVADEQFETFSRVAREWCGRETISFVETKRATRFSEGCCDEKLINELLKRFYAGDRKPTNNEDWKLISLPLVDNVDVLQKRRRILNDCLRRSWHILENYCCLTGCSQRAYDLIATFNLTADNAGLDRDISRFAVAFIFRMGLYDSSVEAEFFPSPNSACSKFHLYIKSFKCDLGRLEKLIEEIFAINCIS
ncbi:hypothetical protein AB6A40_005953 [Gnathostoma spinigerum]|uniref:Uncharacterized protein n=1 Tax=Gnathostoma spinigerum TaxID=75299 RepID=A0ABD6EGZ7_9BILA